MSKTIRVEVNAVTKQGVISLRSVRMTSPPVTPPGTPIDPQCGPEFNAIVDPLVDANNDGFPDVVSFNPAAINPGCEPPTFCETFTLPNGGEGFTPAAPFPILDPALPVPVAAVTSGCSGETQSPVCPVLGSTGEQAEGCEELPADADCLTVTMCPDPGSWEDPSDPDVVRIFDGTSSDIQPFPTPGAVDPEDVLQVLNDLGPLYINPCEWDPVLSMFDFDIDIKGEGSAGNAPCQTNEECKSGECVMAPGDIQGLCEEPRSPFRLNVDEGSSNWNVRFNGGVTEGRVNLRRAVFFPSAEFDVTVQADAELTTAAFGRNIDLYELDITSEISECGYKFDWQSRSGDDVFNVVDGSIRETLGAGVFVPGNVAELEAAADPALAANCEARLSDLHAAEVSVNEAFHDALIASSFFNLAGPNGAVVTSRAAAQGFITEYQNAATAYQDALATFEQAQQAALDHDVAGQIADFEIELEFAFVRSYGIGPFNPGIEIGIYGRAGMTDVEMQNTANTHFTNTATTPCTGTECMSLSAQGSGAMKAAAGLFAFIGGGLNLGVAGGKVGIRGELDIANMKLPAAARFELQRTTLTAGQFLQASPAVPSALSSIFAAPADLLTANLFEVPPVMTQFTAPYAVGAHLQSLGDPLAANAQFLSGRIKLFAKAWFLFVTKKWEKTLVSWQGIPREWHVAPPLGDNTFGDFTSIAGLLAAPNMVLLPKLALSPIPGNQDPTQASNDINAALDTQITDNRNISFDAHNEDNLGELWTTDGVMPRCNAPFVP